MLLEKILNESFNARGDELKDESKLTRMKEWDSMAHMLFITKLEESYDIVLTGDEIASMETVGDIKNMIKQKGKEL